MEISILLFASATSPILMYAVSKYKVFSIRFAFGNVINKQNLRKILMGGVNIEETFLNFPTFGYQIL